MKLLNVSAVITGASQGLGFFISKAFLSEGADITICARGKSQLDFAFEKLSQCNPHHRKILTCQTDISDYHAVEELMKSAYQCIGKISVLVCNAGIYGPKGAIDVVSWKEWSKTIDINLKGTVKTCQAALPYLKKNEYGKIIILSGGGATKPLPNLSAYAVSKIGVVRFAETLAEELREFHIDVNTVSPGALNTRLLDEILEAGAKKVGNTFYQQALKQKETGGVPLELGAKLCLYLASRESDGITGKLISAIWDPWENLANHRNELMNSDVYTLRRITPEERDMSWSQ